MSKKVCAQVPGVLVVSDNSRLVEFIKKIFESKQLSSYRVRFAYTRRNSAPEKLIALGAKEIDAKSDAFIDYAIKTYDVIISMHCKQIFPERLVKNIRCINVHPGLNPHNRGWFPQVFSIVNKKPIGATIHEMDGDIDHGPILCQKEVEVTSSDTSLEVYERVLHAEKSLLEDHLAEILEGRVLGRMPGSDGNYNSISDFRAICKLDMESRATLREHIDLLRALSHGDFRNAYFISENGEKVYVSLSLERE